MCVCVCVGVCVQHARRYFQVGNPHRLYSLCLPLDSIITNTGCITWKQLLTVIKYMGLCACISLLLKGQKTTKATTDHYRLRRPCYMYTAFLSHERRLSIPPPPPPPLPFRPPSSSPSVTRADTALLRALSCQVLARQQ